jgi:hypothetical protein
VGTTLDDKALFDEQDLKIQIGTWQRASVERSIPGLDGTVSIDLGCRSRTIRQRGILKASSQAAMHSRLDAIEVLLDGDTHTLVTADGQTYANLRVDAFKPLDRDTSGVGAVVEYEIVYTQLGS